MPARARIASAALAGVIVLSGCGTTTSSVATGGSDPAVFAVAQGSGGYPPATVPGAQPGHAPSPAPTGAPAGTPVLQVRSATTGALVRSLGVTEPGNLSVTTDGTTIYYESTSAGHLDPFPIDRIAATGGPPVTVASGEYPTISPDGSTLATATGDGHAIAIDDLVHHRTRRVELAGLMGGGASFNTTFGGAVVWLGDGRLLAIPPANGEFYTGGVVRATTTTTVASAAGQPTCTAMYQRHEQCAIIIDSGSGTARLMTLSSTRALSIGSYGPGPSPGTVLFSLNGTGVNGTVAEYAIGATTATAGPTWSVPNDGLVEAFSPSGRRLLYLRGHGPIELWRADLPTSGGAIVSVRQLLAQADLGGAAW